MSYKFQNAKKKAIVGTYRAKTAKKKNIGFLRPAALNRKTLEV